QRAGGLVLDPGGMGFAMVAPINNTAAVIRMTAAGLVFNSDGTACSAVGSTGFDPNGVNPGAEVTSAPLTTETIGAVGQWNTLIGTTAPTTTRVVTCGP